MAFMKTAISIDEEIFNEAEKLSAKLHVSRSQLFSQAVEYLINKSESLEIIQKINAVYSDKDVFQEQKNLAKSSKKRMKGLIDKW